MARIGNGPFYERRGYIDWDDPDYLSDEFLLTLFKNASKIKSITDKNQNLYGFSGYVFGNMRFKLFVFCKQSDNSYVFDRGSFSIEFGSYEYPDFCFVPGGWDILQVNWLLDEAAVKRIWSLYKKYKNEIS